MLTAARVPDWWIRRLGQTLVILLVILAPSLTGLNPAKSLHTRAGMVVAAAFCLYAFLAAPRRWARQAALAILAFFSWAAVIDVVSRPLLERMIYHSAHDRIIRWWPRMPLVPRYEANAHLRTRTFGDLAAVSGNEVAREYREERFVTDAYGFRNEATGRPDVILLGDSFGVGTGTSQERTWGTLLASQYGWRLYNLSVGGAGPWGEYINLSIEIGRLREKDAGAVVLWALFTGNDLDDACYGMLSPAELPWNSGWATFERTWELFRSHSPVRRLVDRTLDPRAASDKVIVRRLPDGRPLLFSRDYAQRMNRTLEDVVRLPNYACVEAVMGAMNKLAERQRLRVTVLVLPSKEEVYDRFLDRHRASRVSGFSLAFQDLSRRNGMDFLDLTPYFVEQSQRLLEESGELLWWRDDSHWNERGHALAASLVHSRVLARLIR